MGAKLVTFFPGNAALAKHTHHAMIQLFNAETGEPLAVMDGRLITEMRTAATSAIAVDLLPYQAFAYYVREPSGAMPPFSEKILSDADLSDIHAYLDSLPKPPSAAGRALIIVWHNSSPAPDDG